MKVIIINTSLEDWGGCLAEDENEMVVLSAGRERMGRLGGEAVTQMRQTTTFHLDHHDDDSHSGAETSSLETKNTLSPANCMSFLFSFSFTKFVVQRADSLILLQKMDIGCTNHEHHQNPEIRKKSAACVKVHLLVNPALSPFSLPRFGVWRYEYSYPSTTGELLCNKQLWLKTGENFTAFARSLPRKL